MHRTLFSAVLCTLLAFINMPTFAQDSLLVKDVRTLGISDSSHLYSKLSLLEKNSSKAVELLIRELKPIPEIGRILPEEVDKYLIQVHVVWCIRALRYLTAIDFTARTNYVFSDSEKVRSQFVHSKDGACSFFGVHMAHDVIYLAPLDAQRAIILKWQDWYKSNKDQIKLDRSLDFNSWYF